MSNIAKFVILAAALLATLPVFAGGFWLQMGTPDANPEAKAKNAVLVVRATGCHDPATARVTGVAIQMTKGRKQTIPLKVVPLKEPGTFAVLRDWTSDADVTLEFVGREPAGNQEMTTSMLVKAHGDIVEKGTVKFYRHPPTQQEELALLER